ncbi:hypothetical protein [Methylobacterium sp. CM6247]
MSTIALGQTVKDAITGLEGVVVARYEYHYGCTRLSVQPTGLVDGKAVESFCEDEQRFLVLDRPNILTVAPLTNAPGGDRPSPPVRTAPSR